ncbi:MAG: gliding motility-associated protein GldE [Candidatus Dadabacteria bacterium]
MDYSSDIYIHTLAQIIQTVAPEKVIFLVLLLLVLLLLSFIVSGAEVALFSLQTKEINILKTKQHPAAKRITTLLDERKAVYASLLISAGVFNICIIILLNFLLSPFLSIPPVHFLVTINLNLLVKVVIIAFILVFFGKILPKLWATQDTLRFAYTVSATVEALHLLLRQISLKMVSIADTINTSSGATDSEATSMRELDDAIDINNVQTSVEEKNILKGIIKFSNISVKQIMRFRLDVNGIDYNLPMPQVIRKIEELHYSRLPVYKENLDSVVGILNTRDLLQFVHAEQFDWHSLIRPTLFVPETKLIKDLLNVFQTRRIHFAVVVDEFGGTSGIVTMEDILEEIIGDIKDEFDEEENAIRQLDESNYVVDAKMLLYDLCRALRLSIDTFDEVKGESDSLAGLVLELAGKFPAVNDKVVAGDFEFTVLEIEKNRIKTVKVFINIHKNER